MYFQRLNPDELITRLAAIVDSSDDAVIGRDEQGTINTWNSAATRIFGYRAEEIVGQSGLLMVPPELHKEELANLETVQRGERILPHETERLRKGGARIAVALAITPIKDESGRVLGSAVMAREVSAQQREQADRARLAAIVESSDDAIIAKDLNGIVTEWNAAAERTFGYTRDEMVGRSIMTIIPPELQHEEPVILSKIRAGLRLEHYETQRVHKSGRRIEIQLSLSPIRDARGKVIGASKIARDITERRKSEAARLQLAAIVESSDDAIISKNLDGVIMSWNAAAQRLFGYEPEEIIGFSVMRLIPRELHHEEPQIISKLRRGERIEHFETRRLRKDGKIIDVSLTVSPIKDTLGRVIGASKIVRDISDRKLAEAALMDRERLATAGRLAATLAHEVNNPLEAIMNLAYVLSTHESLDPEARAFADLLVHEVQRAGEITRQTLSYYRDSRSPVRIDIADLMQHLLRAKASKLEQKKISVATHLPPEAIVSGFPGELRQVFDNLVENAIHAVEPEGNILIRGRIFGHEAERVAISVCDDGVGIPRPLQRRIFESFFTTKSEGSGLGLWVASSIVQKHQGTIRVRSSQSPARHGSVFTVTMPLATTRDEPRGVETTISVGG